LAALAAPGPRRSGRAAARLCLAGHRPVAVRRRAAVCQAAPDRRAARHHGRRAGHPDAGGDGAHPAAVPPARRQRPPLDPPGRRAADPGRPGAYPAGPAGSRARTLAAGGRRLLVPGLPAAARAAVADARHLHPPRRIPIEASMSLHIRPASADDAGLILRFITDLAIYEKAEHEVRTDVEGIRASLFAADGPARALICERDGEPIGYAVYFFNYSTWLGRAGLYLEDLYVD